MLTGRLDLIVAEGADHEARSGEQDHGERGLQHDEQRPSPPGPPSLPRSPSLHSEPAAPGLPGLPVAPGKPGEPRLMTW